MNCNSKIHNEIETLGGIFCPFCDRKLEDSYEKPQDRYDCCDSPDMINDNGMLVCRICGIVQQYESSTEYVDFYENIRKIRRKSVYHRKYHVSNILTGLSIKHNITISVFHKSKILRIFSEIDKILPQINGERTRIISVNFLIKKILKRMKLPHSYVKITKSKKLK